MNLLVDENKIQKVREETLERIKSCENLKKAGFAKEEEISFWYGYLTALNEVYLNYYHAIGDGEH